jgi:hypothetical protein
MRQNGHMNEAQRPPKIGSKENTLLVIVKTN